MVLLLFIVTKVTCIYIYVYDIILKRDLTLAVKCFTQYSTILFKKPIKFGIQDD